MVFFECNAIILYRESNYHKKIIKEALEMYKNGNNFNKYNDNLNNISFFLSKFVVDLFLIFLYVGLLFYFYVSYLFSSRNILNISCA